MNQRTTKTPEVESAVAAHYNAPGLANKILRTLDQTGADPKSLCVDDFAPVDEFHVRGRESTAELAAMLELKKGAKVLDVGSGLGGTARFLASEFETDVTGLDLTQSYCDAATRLSAQVGLTDRTRFRQGSALALPFEDASFDVVWTEHVQMNIEDKRQFYAEALRVLRPAGQLVFHDIFEGSGGAISFPVPWAADQSMSFLASANSTRELLADLGLTEQTWVDTTETSARWFEMVIARNKEAGGPPPLGLHLLMGESAKTKFANLAAGLREGRLATIQGVLRK